MPALGEVIEKLGAFPEFAKALGALHKVEEQARPKGALLGTVMGRDRGADTAAISKARTDVHTSLKALMRDADEAGVGTGGDLKQFKSQVADYVKADVGADAHPNVLAFMETPYGKGKPRVAMNSREARNATQKHRLPQGRVEGSEDAQLPGGRIPELEGETSRTPGDQGLAGRAGDVVGIPESGVSSRKIQPGDNLDELIQSLQGKGYVMGAEKFRGPGLPSTPRGDPSRLNGVAGRTAVQDPELGTIDVDASMPAQERIPGMGARRTYNLAGPRQPPTDANLEDMGGDAPGQQTLDDLLKSLVGAR